MSDTSFKLSPEQEFGVRTFFERIPFNRLLGVELDELSTERVVMHLSMRDDLIGNFVQGILHGGVIATLLDVAGGAMALIATLQRMHSMPSLDSKAKLSKLGTIDLRVDYLRPGRGQRFTAEAVLLRSGNKVAVVRSELHNEQGVLVAVGTGTYLCG